jgi:ABC-2 type transport system ATP-binding protein
LETHVTSEVQRDGARNGAGDGDAVIVTTQLTKVFPTRNRPPLTAVDHLDLEIHGGEIFGLLGPNGAGKTTTVGMLTTRVVPTAGRAWVAGIDVIAHPTLAKQAIGVVPQVNTLDRSLNVYENLYFHARYYGIAHRHARRISLEQLERFRLADRADADVGELSGGMAQRLMVARAMLHRPPVLFLDEPTAGLDPQSRLALWDAVRDLHREGQTILMTTHYMEEADRLCNRVAIMDHGHILALDTPAALKSGVAADTEIRLATDDNVDALAETVGRLPGVDRVQTTPGEVRVYVRRDGSTPASVLAAADAAGYRITDLGINQPTLETVFINLTGRDLRE